MTVSKSSTDDLFLIACKYNNKFISQKLIVDIGSGDSGSKSKNTIRANGITMAIVLP